MGQVEGYTGEEWDRIMEILLRHGVLEDWGSVGWSLFMVQGCATLAQALDYYGEASAGWSRMMGKILDRLSLRELELINKLYRYHFGKAKDYIVRKWGERQAG